MSDPISLTGTAVGVVSLGLQVCGEIVSYCQAWKGFDEDIRNFSQKADGLRIPLEVLRGLLANSQETDVTTAADIEDKLQHIERVITRLKNATKQFASRASGETAAIRAQFKKATYPFRKNSLREMSSDLDSLQLSLHTILHALSIQTLLNIQQATTRNIHDVNTSIQVIQKQLMPPISPQNRGSAHDNGIAAASKSSLIGSSLIHPDSTPISALYRPRPQANVKWQGRNKIKTYSHSTRILRLAINFTLSVSRGTAGISIVPSLHLRPLRDANSSHVLDLLISFAHSKNERKPGNFQELVSATIIQLQEIFDRGEATPSDIFAYSGEGDSFSMLDYMVLLLNVNTFREWKTLFRFLIDCGSSPGTSNYYYTWVVSASLTSVSLLAGWYDIGSRLIDFYGYIIRPPLSLAEGELLRYLVNQDHDNVTVPEISKAIILESEHDLRAAIASKPSLVNERIGNCSLLDLAFGWPRGIQILLQAGADAHAYEINFVQDTRSKNIYDSVKLLLKAGCKFSFHHIENCNEVENGDNMRDLLIRELITRLQGLWELAKLYLQPDECPTLIDQDKNSKNTVIFDVRTTQVYAKLSEHGIAVDPSLQTPHIYRRDSVYHCEFFSAKTMQKLYDFGFRGVNDPDISGALPLMAHGSLFSYSMGELRGQRLMEQVLWLISKHADTERLVPGTSSTVGHHLTHGIIRSFENSIQDWIAPPKGLLAEWKNYKDMIANFWSLVVITPLAGDGCLCACSPSWCSAISLLLRQAIQFLSSERGKINVEDPGFWFREMVTFSLPLTGDNLEVYRAVIRFLTFDALGLRHVCCVEESVGPWYYLKLQDRDRQEVEEILDEERLGLEDLEMLVTEFEAKFDELGLPIMDFLQGCWYSRMASFLLERDPYDQEHVLESRKLGVELKAEDWVLPNRVSLLIRPPVEEIES